MSIPPSLHMLTFAGIVEPAFAEYLSSLTDVPATLETAERDSSGKVTLGLIHNCILCPFSNGNLVTSAIQNNFACWHITVSCACYVRACHLAQIQLDICF